MFDISDNENLVFASSSSIKHRELLQFQLNKQCVAPKSKLTYTLEYAA